MGLILLEYFEPVSNQFKPQRKNVSVDSMFEVCRSDHETIDRILVKCPMAAQCWQLILPQIDISENGDFVQWWGKILASYDIEKRAEIATIC